VAIVASLSAVNAGLLDDLMGGGSSQGNVVEIENITFNTSNANETAKMASSLKFK
jgi:hypothetical protein